MQKSRRKNETPKRVLALPDLEQTKSAVLSTLTSKSGQRSYDHAINEFVRLVLLGAATGIQPHRGLALPNISRAEASSSDYHQPSACRRQADCLRGG